MKKKEGGLGGLINPPSLAGCCSDTWRSRVRLRPRRTGGAHKFDAPVSQLSGRGAKIIAAPDVPAQSLGFVVDSALKHVYAATAEDAA